MKFEPQVEGNNPFLCRNLVKIRPTVWALEGSKIWKITNTQLAAAVASADQSSSDQSSCHFFGKTHLMNTRWRVDCVIAKVDPSKSADCGQNQLMLIGAPYFYGKNEFGAKICQVYGQLLVTENRIFAGNSWPSGLQNFDDKLIFYIKIWCHKKSADLDNKQLI